MTKSIKDEPSFPEPTANEGVSIWTYFMAELTHGYQLNENEQLYSEKQRRVSTFMKTPRELEKFMLFGFFICLDAFIFLFTFLPLRLLLASGVLFYRFITCTKLKILDSAHLIDIIRASILCFSMFGMSYIDTSALYHIIRAQSVIKLYVIYNMLEIFDRLLASIGQDTLDTLYWLAASYNRRNQSKSRFKTAFYFLMATIYVWLLLPNLCIVIHTNLILVQATTLSVAMNSHSKALLTIMVSNNFVELKGSVFKKFEINNLFQMSCSDIRERFHYVILMMVVIIRNFSQSGDMSLMLPIALSVIVSEVIVDCVKHAFITKFNDISPDVYRKYRLALAKDLTDSRSTKATSEHTDMVSRRMGFIPLPLGCLLFRTISQSVNWPHMYWLQLGFAAYLSLMSLKVLLGIILLKLARRYHKMDAKNKKEPDVSAEMVSRSLDDFAGAESSAGFGLRRRPSLTSDSPIVAALKIDNTKAKARFKSKSKSLSDVERFTLCSNRIV